MAETVKKAKKAPAKPGKAATTKAKTPVATAKKTKTAAKPLQMPTPQMHTPSHDQIAELARKYWAERGYSDGQHEDDWFRAEQELRAKAS